MHSIVRTLKRRIVSGRRLSRVLSDEQHARWLHEVRLGRAPDLDHPATFGEKILWLKLRAPDPGLAQLADKLAVRGYVAERCGAGVLNELLGVFERVEDVDPSRLPDAFVLKPTHASGMNVICPDRSALDWGPAAALLRKALSRDYYWTAREPVYRGLPRRLVCERFLGRPGETLPDYKLFCFEGEPRLIQVDLDRFGDHRRAMLDPAWRPLDFAYEYPRPERVPAPPSRLEELLARARQLARGLPFVRVDLYQVDERVIFGELTFYPEGGFGRFTPELADQTVGDLLQLPVPPRRG